MLLLFALLISLLFIIISSSKFRLHPFLGLLGGALIYGLFVGMDLDLILQSINEGFGGLMGNIGIIILFGVMIGTFLERSGGALVLAKSVLSWIGERFVTLAMMITGYIISIPVFADSGFIIMSPLNKALAKRAAVPLAATTAALATGLLASHVMVPPTPGPVAAAGILEANLGQVLIWGIIVSSLTCVICYFIIVKFISKIQLSNVQSEVLEEKPDVTHLTPFKAFLPIIIPILLIVIGSVADLDTEPFGDGTFYSWISFIGKPIIALLIGLIISFSLPKKLDREMLSTTGWIGQALKDAAPIILITGAGGIFGKMLQNSGLGDLIVDVMGSSNWGLFVPFLLAAALKTCQGSSTVSLVTSASIMVPLLPALGLETEWMTTLTVLSIAAGSAVASHVNDSFFWVLTQMTGFTVSEGYRIQTVMTATFGVTAMVIIYLISVLI